MDGQLKELMKLTIQRSFLFLVFEIIIIEKYDSDK
jgi:hypothetical protein